MGVGVGGRVGMRGVGGRGGRAVGGSREGGDLKAASRRKGTL